jgi:hypothetical protein
VISISVGDPPGQADTLRRQIDGRFPVIPDPNREIAERYNVDATPYNVLIGKDGVVQQVIVGFDEAGMQRAVQQVVGAS